MAKSDFSCVETRFCPGFCHRASVLQAQVPKLCTDLDVSLLYILILETYSKFTRKINFLYPRARRPRQRTALLRIVRIFLSCWSQGWVKLTKRIGEVDRRRLAELSDLRESKWDNEISWEIPPRYWKGFFKNRNNFRKESFSQNLIDNQTFLYITKFRNNNAKHNKSVAQWCPRPLSDTKDVDSFLTGAVLWSWIFLR